MIDLVCLRSFAHVCESGTVAAAAERLGYSAPAVSQQLAKLERDLGVTLFDRAGGRLRPTERGRTLLDLAARMLDLAERCRHLEPGSGRAEPISVAAFGSAVAEIVAPALRWLPAGAVVVRGVDDDHLPVVADQPDVVGDLPLAAVEGEDAVGGDELDRHSDHDHAAQHLALLHLVERLLDRVEADGLA
ncbi:MAG TPA: LysR family transcriptional regulator, partial [Ilumatobacteraceae bacterium]|nr:LysR family transcriptional regulator [Ilumatobacteraceae bacterium]